MQITLSGEALDKPKSPINSGREEDDLRRVYLPFQIDEYGKAV